MRIDRPLWLYGVALFGVTVACGPGPAIPTETPKPVSTRNLPPTRTPKLTTVPVARAILPSPTPTPEARSTIPIELSRALNSNVIIFDSIMRWRDWVETYDREPDGTYRGRERVELFKVEPAGVAQVVNSPKGLIARYAPLPQWIRADTKYWLNQGEEITYQFELWVVPDKASAPRERWVMKIIEEEYARGSKKTYPLLYAAQYQGEILLQTTNNPTFKKIDLPRPRG